MEGVEFTPWPKINRLKSMAVTVTYKVDGTNAAVHIRDGKLVACQSRNKFITPEQDNMGFANWAYSNADVLSHLGDGIHFGEWACPNIQKNPHKLEKKKFFLFNAHRYEDLMEDEDRRKILIAADIEVVPVLYNGEYDEAVIRDIMTHHAEIDEGFEGVIIYFHDFRTYMKRTVRCPEGKWKGAL